MFYSVKAFESVGFKGIVILIGSYIFFDYIEMEFLESKLKEVRVTTDVEATTDVSLETPNPCIVITEESCELESCMETLRQVKELALDCEGVDLGRAGQICIVQLSTREQCYLLDVHGISKSSKLALFLKEILESLDIVKIIHDCSMDADALCHHLNIRIRNIHDTQCWDKQIHHTTTNTNLNNTLVSYNLLPNSVRNCSIYDTQPTFWATRPMTPNMIDWASGDVKSLFLLYDKQCELASPEEAAAAQKASTHNARLLPSLMMTPFQVHPDNMGRLIGKGGCNIRALKEKHPRAFIVAKRNGVVWIYAENNIELHLITKRLARYR